MMKSYETIIDNKKILMINELRGTGTTIKDPVIKHVYEALEEEQENHEDHFENEDENEHEHKYKHEYDKNFRKNYKEDLEEEYKEEYDEIHRYIEHHYVQDEEYYDSKITILEKIEKFIKWILERSKTGFLKIKKILKKHYDKRYNKGL